VTVCPRKHGRHGVCGAVLEPTSGRCWACDRLARGVCRDCEAPVDGTVGKARRCAVHRATVRQAWRAANPEKVQGQKARRVLRAMRRAA
jgi:hypothetical protein